ncbi:hypothetical protein OEZ86_002012 [Tetradesmus obliquus]|nr:hypothetical protein OEZ86_002012 [Tetradesmus obliquus]
MAPPDHGPQHRPGYLPRLDNPEEQAAVPNLPAKSGLAGTVLPPAAMFPGSCCPPPMPEPLVAMDPDAKVILAQRQSQRVLEPGGLMNRLGPDDPTLVFESRFECGNLRRVVQVYRFEYDLVLQPDINTRGHTQWYYFSVRNMRPGLAYIFNIINLQKPDSLYNMGMLPLLHSAQQMRRKGIGWVRAGSDVYYGPNSIKRGKQQTYFTLTFTMEFPHEDDTVHLAHCYPYSYSDLQNHLYVLLKVVPMLNPDGVVVGNYRCSLAGLDLNRVWQEPDARLQPVICAFKGMIKAFMQEREVVLFVDMHGHSRKYGVFCYGCEKKAIRDSVPHVTGWPVPGSVGGLPGVPAKSLERLFPLMLYINTPDLFSFKSCNFKVQKSKAGTGRVVGFRELGLVNAYTIEASFCGASVGKYAKQHFNTGTTQSAAAAAGAGSAGSGPAQLSQEEAALVAAPGLLELLQQLVQEQAALTEAVGAAAAGSSSKDTKKKGKRRGLARYGNPEVLRAARAKADASLAAALPELG